MADAEEGKMVMLKLKAFTRKCEPSSTLNKLLTMKCVSKYKANRPYQTDSYNCGVFVMYFMYVLGNTIKMDTEFDPNRFRENVAHILLQKSLNVKETCVYCFHEKATQLVMCKYCRRYTHSRCIPGKKKTKAEWAEPTTEFKCTLCACSVRDSMIGE